MRANEMKWSVRALIVCRDACEPHLRFSSQASPTAEARRAERDG